ncbi:calcium-binding protein [Roseicyclus marinus]|uniref:calcium-binding protein n=1 Tax=Roseicyclus marinus TaxID=2161673 RepID=UPI00240FA59E|nr:calcium-binding protein [Roseicyclus marinus]MDG3041033.1 calcium-binding protein [Roseicyclus marinus]
MLAAGGLLILMAMGYAVSGMVADGDDGAAAQDTAGAADPDAPELSDGTAITGNSDLLTLLFEDEDDTPADTPQEDGGDLTPQQVDVDSGETSPPATMGDDAASNGGGLLIEGTEGNDTLTGTDGDDTLDGYAGDDLLDGGTGDDLLRGREGMDSLLGGGGNDAITGGPGDDRIEGGTDTDMLVGNEGNDTILGGAGADEAYGEDGDDLIDGGTGTDFLVGGDGHDTITGGTDDDLLFGNDGDDSLSGEDGDDYLQGGFGADTLSGGAGNDRLDGTFAAGDSLFGPVDEDQGDILDGGDGDDTIVVGAGDLATGGAGADLFATGSFIQAAELAGTVTDFDAAQDVIEVMFDPALTPDPVITVQDFPDGSGAHILFNGDIILSVSGAQGLDPALIQLRSVTLDAVAETA